MGGGPAFSAARDCGRFWVSLFVLAAVLTFMFREPAIAQEVPACAPAIARVVSLQGDVQVQRGGAGSWSSVRRLDTTVCEGDLVRVADLSRAALFVQPETLIRLDQNTTITLRQTVDETHVELHADEPAAGAQQSHCCGAVYLITRFPKKFKVTTPHMNAAVEGTEFMVEASREASKLTVIEGAVSSESLATGDTKLVSAGQSVGSGPSGATAITTVIRPQDAVQWVLRYPPISDQSGPSELSVAEKLLRGGSVDDALNAIDAEIAGNPSSSDAHAVRSVIQVAKNDKASALESARKATVIDATSYRGWLAMSYAQQAAFDLQGALASAQQASNLEAGSALAKARVAELYLSLGDPRHANEAALASVNAGPDESAAHTILGFVHLAQIDTRAARAAFIAAIERDSFNALPRLGLGLAKIRDGQLNEGRVELEIAVALDPSNSLLRSYVGKAYYEENSKERDTLAAQQFDQASALDPQDPTPHFYDAILVYSQSRPVDALAGLRKSTQLNDGRAVYRSRQLLDQDLAARNASQATVYNELGFHQLGLTAASESLALDPGSGSAHRFLADIYATTPRHEIARASELLQSQLRQPLGAFSLQTQLANDVAFTNTFFGPSSVGVNEFNSLFLRDDLRFQVFGLLGDQDTWGDQVVITSLHGPVSFSVGQLATDTDGYRPNNDDSVTQYNGFVQAQFGAGTSAQFEITSADREHGDLRSAFDAVLFSPVMRNDVSTDSQRIGFRQVIDANSDFLISIVHRDRDQRQDDANPLPLTIDDDEDVWKGEVQYLRSGTRVDFVAGASYFEGKANTEIVSPFFMLEFPSEPRHINAYSYLQFAPRSGVPLLQLGLSYDDFSSNVGDQSEFNPKLGLTWDLGERLTFRAAMFRVLKRRIGSDQGLEPTQLAGFNQFFDDTNGTVSEGGSFAADGRLADSFSAGFQVSRRNLKAPTLLPDGSVLFDSRREDVVSGYVYWLPSERLSFTFEPRYQDFEHGSAFDDMQLTELPISLRWFSPSGLRWGVTATAVEQEGVFDGPGQSVTVGSDSFWLLDAIVAYRLPRRNGTISLEGTNLLDEEFRFQETNLAILSPRYVPDAQVRLRVSLSF